MYQVIVVLVLTLFSPQASLTLKMNVCEEDETGGDMRKTYLGGF